MIGRRSKIPSRLAEQMNCMEQTLFLQRTSYCPSLTMDDASLHLLGPFDNWVLWGTTGEYTDDLTRIYKELVLYWVL